jgi:hypothetical protein
LKEIYIELCVVVLLRATLAVCDRKNRSVSVARYRIQH